MSRTSTSLAVWGLLGAVGLALFIMLYKQAFPQASLEVDINHSEARILAEEYVRSRGYDVSDFKRATVFYSEDLPQIFLQRVWGIQKFNEEVQKDPELAQWGYGTRFFRPLHKEEYLVWMDTLGNIQAFQHLLEETAPGASITKAQALENVEQFVSDDLGDDLSRYEEKDYSAETLPNRTDHSFSFELIGSSIDWSEDEDAGKGAKRLDIVVQGDEIGWFSKQVFVPEGFARNQEMEDSYGELYIVIASLASFFLILAAVVVLLRGYKQGDLRVRSFYWLAAVLIVFSVFEAIGSFELILFDYSTAEPFATFIIIVIVFAFMALLLTVAELLLSGVTGESLTRSVFPTANDLDPQKQYAMRDRWVALMRGIASGCIFLGYIAVFYYVGARYFGIWSPLDHTVADFMGNRFPFIAPIALSLGAALTEEFSFRYFGVSFLKRYVKWTALALLIPAVIWAFLHSTYAVYPMHIRGIELTIAGVFFGWIFIRYGIFTAIVAHYVVDAVLFSIPLLLSSDLYMRFSGVVPIAFVFAMPLLYKLMPERR